MLSLEFLIGCRENTEDVLCFPLKTLEGVTK